MAPTRARKKSAKLKVDEHLAAAIRRKVAAQWLKRNRAALASYNEHIEKHGAWSDGRRSF